LLNCIIKYLLQNSKDNKKEEYFNRSSFGANSKMFQLEVKLVKKLHDHTKEIKYIDFNARLNILLTYSLDNYINIYIFPKLKLINTIDIISFKVSDDNDFLVKVVLISFPFPSIICHSKKYIYQLSINGELIKYKKLEEGDKVIFSIDKNLGLVEDKVVIYNSENKYKNTFNYNNKKIPEDFLIL
jgi:WD40 repeat protein